jgi:hypothetical protein
MESGEVDLTLREERAPMKPVVGGGIVGLALIVTVAACAKPAAQPAERQASPGAIAAAANPTGPCATIGYEYAKAYGTIEKIVADVAVTRAQFIEQDNTRGAGAEPVPTGAKGAEQITVCMYDGNFDYGGRPHGMEGKPMEFSRVSIIVDSKGEAMLRSIGPRDRVPLVVQP